MKKTLLSGIGEFSLIKRIEKKLFRGLPGASRVLIDIGDDAFAARFSAGRVLVATNDVLVENVHFRRGWISPAELGYKALAVNLSDLAAMGGAKPLYAFSGLAMPAGTAVDFVDKLLTGMNRACAEFGFIVAGGDTVSSKKDIVISVTLLGEIDPGRLIRRSGAKPGDIIYVSGSFGDSGAGLKILEDKARGGSAFEKALVKKHLLPVPRMELAGRLSKTGKVTAMIDSSDGLAASLKFISEKSSVGADIFTDLIPISKELKKLSLTNRKLKPLWLALNGGEDYELVFTVKPGGARTVENISPDITRIGVVNGSGRVKYFSGGSAVNIEAAGYQAFHR